MEYAETTCNFSFSSKNNSLQLNIHEAWCQRNNGSWKNLLEKDLSFPVVNLLSQVDSLEQLEIDKNLL